MPAVDDYLENQVLTASPHRLHLLVVEGAIRFARRGQSEMQAERWEAMDQALGRSRDCVTELIGGLDVNAWPPMAEQLKSLFVFIYRNLALAELERNPQRIEDACRLLQLHRETWLELGVTLQSTPVAALSDKIPAPHSTSRSWVT